MNEINVETFVRVYKRNFIESKTSIKNALFIMKIYARDG